MKNFHCLLLFLLIMISFPFDAHMTPKFVPLWTPPTPPLITNKLLNDALKDYKQQHLKTYTTFMLPRLVVIGGITTFTIHALYSKFIAPFLASHLVPTDQRIFKFLFPIFGCYISSLGVAAFIVCHVHTRTISNNLGYLACMRNWLDLSLNPCLTKESLQQALDRQKEIFLKPCYENLNPQDLTAYKKMIAINSDEFYKNKDKLRNKNQPAYKAACWARFKLLSIATIDPIRDLILDIIDKETADHSK